MTISSDAMLYFGFIAGEEDEPPEWLYDEEGNLKDFDDLILDLAGVDPNISYAKRKPIIDACPAELQTYCSYDYPMYILAIRGYSHVAKRGHTEEISVESLSVRPEAIENFKDWCNQNKIEYRQPRWFLCSMYG
jgi:hypothetical protein